MTPSLISSSLIRYCIGHIKGFGLYRVVQYSAKQPTPTGLYSIGCALCEQLHRVRTHVLDVGGGIQSQRMWLTKQTINNGRIKHLEEESITS